MKTLINQIKKWLVPILFILFIIFIARECTNPLPPQEPTIEIVKDTVWDTIAGDDIRVPYPVYQDTGSTKWKYKDIDTAAILTDYFSTVFYRDTILNDSSAIFIVKDSIHMNRIKVRETSYKLYNKAINTTTTITEPAKLRNKVFVGLGAGGSPTSFGLSLNLMLITKKDNAYSISYDGLNKDIWFTMYWKIKLKK